VCQTSNININFQISIVSFKNINKNFIIYFSFLRLLIVRSYRKTTCVQQGVNDLRIKLYNIKLTLVTYQILDYFDIYNIKIIKISFLYVELIPF